MGIMSVQQDARAHDRWHSLGDGYLPRPGDWVLFNGHVEVITSYGNGVLHTIGGDSLPNYSVNAHTYASPLADTGITGFVDNGHLTASAGVAPGTKTSGQGQGTNAGRARTGTNAGRARTGTNAGRARRGANPGGTAPAADPISAIADAAPGPASPQGNRGTTAGSPHHGQAVVPGASPSGAAASPSAASPSGAAPSAAAPSSRPGAGQAGAARKGRSSGSARAAAPTATASVPTASAQHAFINEVAPAAIATQREYGVPASVTIAQAIDESGWGLSELATKAHNLFGIKGAGPAGSLTLPTREYENGSWVPATASFRAYNDYAESIADHGRLLATASVYRHAMADRTMPDAFAADLAGVYATNPSYGGQLVGLMRLYDLYRFDVPAAGTSGTAAPGTRQGHPPGSPAGAARIPAMAGGASGGPAPGGSTIPGTPDAPSPATAATATATTALTTPDARQAAKPYRQRIPLPVATAFITTAKVPLTRNEPLYRDVAELAQVPWQMLAACDWLQCEARPGYSPVHGEKLGKKNADKTIYRTKSEALGQCAADLIELSEHIYGIDVTTRQPLSVHDLANAFAAFRWGSALRRNGISAMEFPYSVAGLTPQYTKMCWPKIPGPGGPDKPGTRFRGQFGAVPILLSLNYPATVLSWRP
jgi:flagellum-specific peptidoglycan hydrolase FlgJ